METYGKILLIAMPAFLGLVLFEKWFAWRKGVDNVNTQDMISSLLSGVTNVTKDVLGISIAIYGYGWLLENLSIYNIKATWLTYVVAFLVLDFSGYAVHRIQHRYNFFWNGHLVHHSSEEFNLACALRQSISGLVKIFAIFLLPAALLGVPEKVIAVVAPLHLFAQFWYHTVHIKKMGFLEKIIVTPSHHRVHHAINLEYLDKNYSQIFIFWDKLFGTFQEELPDKPPVYGITRPVQTWNPIKINFQHVALLIKDAWHTQNWKDKIRIWLMPTGWRPADVSEKYPIYKINDVYDFKKYTTYLLPFMRSWLWVQLIALLLFISYLFGSIAHIGAPGIFLYGVFIFLFVYAFSELMDNHKMAWIWEFVKFIYAAIIIISTKDWFRLNDISPYLKYFILFYLLISLTMTGYFCMGFKRIAMQEANNI
ncbi:sterol desaturase family protein [Niabella ginsengisoli]|uniref:Sterol desaturase family protein n=1 Tax=Niabella ginsengisoli TaxID=522298 RepID=A0ABS9SK88_9BACT|nr:sterol desaturase family protein [Niabella ginsengisoli]MCH5598757.1 sterol desaturase family protein [Niabella ginsengisoli]